MMDSSAPASLAPRRALLPRLHLFELLDQAWCPAALREPMTDYLQTVSVRFGLFDAAAEVLARGLRAGGGGVLLDLGSGGGGPLPRLRQLLQAQHGLRPRLLLSDKYPTVRARAQVEALGDPDVTYVSRPVDALGVPEDLRGMRTLFNALHHFRPEEARAILADAQAKGAPIAVFEAVRRTPAGVLSMLTVPLQALLLTPLVRPLTPLRLLLTYVLPVLPLSITWDGVVSALRAHSPAELRAMTDSLARDGYTWEVGEARAPGRPAITYVLGRPTAR